jgi:hypothetical protein
MRADRTEHRLYVVFTSTERTAGGAVASTRRRAFGPFDGAGIDGGRLGATAGLRPVRLASRTPAGKWQLLLEGEAGAPPWDSFTVCSPAKGASREDLERFGAAAAAERAPAHEAAGPGPGEDRSAAAYLCPACSAGDCVCCGRPYAGAPAFICDGCAAEAAGRCVRCGAAAGGPRACLCGSCGVTSEDCVICGGPAAD